MPTYVNFKRCKTVSYVSEKSVQDYNFNLSASASMLTKYAQIFKVEIEIWKQSGCL